MLVDVIHGSHNAVLEFLFGRDADMAEAERASLKKKPSTKFSQEPCLGVKVNSKRPAGFSASQTFVSLEMCAE